MMTRLLVTDAEPRLSISEKNEPDQRCDSSQTSPSRDSSQMIPSRVETLTKHNRAEMMLF